MDTKHCNIPSVRPSVLGLATTFNVIPSASNNVGGIIDNEVWKTIHTGFDSYANVVSMLMPTTPSTRTLGYFYHGMMAFNFRGTTLWNTNLSILTPSKSVDLYSVALHEITHALGFVTAIKQNGTSVFGTKKYYNRYDTFLKNSSGSQFLISKTGSCNSMYNNNFVLNSNILQPTNSFPNASISNTTNCNNSLKFYGNSFTVPVYTPNVFENGSSLSHFEDQCFRNTSTGLLYGNDAYFLMCNAGGTGVTKRFLKKEERAALCDIGYSVKTTFGTSTTANGYINYGGVVCTGITVAGTNDGLNNGGTYTFAGNQNENIVISGATLLSNDRNATSFECLEDITAAATLSTRNGNANSKIIFKSPIGGIHLLRYVPINASGQKGNITYVYVKIKLLSCEPTPVECNLVLNGDFEQNNSIPNHLSQLVEMACGWDDSHFSTDYYHTASNDIYTSIPCNGLGYENTNNSGGNAYAGFGTWRFYAIPNSLMSEVLKTKLISPLLPNTTYSISFDISLADTFNQNATRIQAYLSTTNITSYNIGLPIPDPTMLFTNPTYLTNPNGWQTVTFTFTTTTGGQEYLYIGNINYSGLPDSNVFISNVPTINPFPTTCTPSEQFFGNGPGVYYYIDNIKLKPELTFNLPSAICKGSTPPVLPATSINGISGSWSPAEINSDVPGSTNYTFTPTPGQCASSIVKTISVNDCNILISPKLNTLSAHSFCYNSTLTQTSPQNIYDIDSGGGIIATIGGMPCNGSNVMITNVTPPFPAGFSINPNGFPIVAPNTLPFEQRFTMDICPLATPGNNCVNVIYDASVRGGVNPKGDSIIVLPSGTICQGATNVLTNDFMSVCSSTVIGTPVILGTGPTNCTLTVLGSSPYMSIVPSTGQIQLDINNRPPLYTTVYLTYQLCNNAIARNCRTATVSIRTVSNCSSFKMANNIAIDKNEVNDQEIIVFPNPSTGLFNIGFKNKLEQNTNIKIYNFIGQIVFEKEVNEIDSYLIDLSHLPSGNYLAKISEGNSVYSKQLFKE